MNRLFLYATISFMYKEILKKIITSKKQLEEFLGESVSASSSSFCMKLPLRLAKKIQSPHETCPIMRQFVPLNEELIAQPEELIDPVADAAFQKTPRLLHKYHGRVLLITTGACAMHCRYCFRQNFDYPFKNGFEPEIEYIKIDPSIHEVILSGGDPLSLETSKLHALFAQINQIDHIHTIRIHTRFIIGVPERIDEAFLELMSQSKKQIIFVIHCNHAIEIDSDVTLAAQKIQNLGIPILVQTVLLKHVNDHVETLKELSLTCIKHGWIPYYLFHLDKVTGSKHHEVSIEKGKRLIKQLRSQLPGYAVWRYAVEIPHEPNKTILL